MRSVLALLTIAGGLGAFACGELLAGPDETTAPVRDAGADLAVGPPIDGSAPDVVESCGETCPAERLAVGLVDIVALTVDASGIYVAQFAPAGFFRIDRNGGAATPIAPASGAPFQANDIRTDANDVYLSQFGTDGVQRRSKTGAGSAVLSSCVSVFSIAVTASAVFAATNCDGGGLTYVHRIDLAGGPLVSSAGDPILPDGGGAARYATSLYGYVAVDASFVYLTNVHAIMRLPLGFAAGAPLAVFHDVPEAVIQNLVVDDRLYVRTTNDVRSYDKGGSPGPDIIVATAFQSSSSRLALAVDQDAVYYADINGTMGPRSVIRRPKGSASQPVVIADTATEATAIALDGPLVYWATKGGEVWRAGKKTTK